jgi:hypothetical protein
MVVLAFVSLTALLFCSLDRWIWKLLDLVHSAQRVTVIQVTVIRKRFCIH